MYVRELFDSILVFLIAFLLAGVILLPVEKLGIAEKISARFGWSKRKVERWLMLMALALGMLGAFGICAVAYIYFDINLFLAPWAKEHDAQNDLYTTRNKMIYIAAFVSLSGVIAILLRGSRKGEKEVDAENTPPHIPLGLLNGKRFLFVAHDAQAETSTKSEIPHSLGLFYLLCDQLGSNITVASKDGGNFGLWTLLCGNDTLMGEHYSEEKQKPFDYVVFLGNAKQEAKEPLAPFRNAINTKTVILTLENTDSNVLEGNNVVVDLGRVINAMIASTAALDSSALTYTHSSFFNKDGAPNYLSAYIASVMLYCCLTCTKAADIPTTMFQDYSTRISMEDHLAQTYDNPDSETNCAAILTTQEELERIHKIIDRHNPERQHCVNPSEKLR